MLVTSIFSFYHNVFKRLCKQGRVKSGMCGKELSILSHFDSIEDVRIWFESKSFNDIFINLVMEI